MIGANHGYDIFLGGTTNQTTWRNEFIELMHKKNPKIKCFNPIVDNWTQECIDLENFVKKYVSYHVYVLTPRMMGVYSIAEMIDSVHISSAKVYVYIKDSDFDNNGNEIKWEPHMRNSLNAVIRMVIQHGGEVMNSINEIVDKIDKTYRDGSKPRNIFS